MSNIYFNPQSGSGNSPVEVCADCNPSIDTDVITYKAETADGGASDQFTVKQKGKREVFMVKTEDGSGYEEFVLSDNEKFGVVKEEYKDDPYCSFLGISGLIARYSARGLTNEQMLQTNLLKDLTGHGYDIELHNFAWSGMSGIGGYNADFSINFHSDPETIYNQITYNKIISTATTDEFANASYSVYGTSVTPGKFKFIVTGIGEELTKTFNVQYRLKSESEGYHNLLSIYKNGEYEVEIPQDTGIFLFSISNCPKGHSVIIEQLPLRKGALVSDGVDDYGVCENFPILTKENGYTVVAVRKWLDSSLDSPKKLLSDGTDYGTGSLMVESKDADANGFSALSFGSRTDITLSESDFIYQTSTSYCGDPISTGDTNTNPAFSIFSNYDLYDFSKIALYDLLIYNRDLTEEEIGVLRDHFMQTSDDSYFLASLTRGQSDPDFTETHGSISKIPSIKTYLIDATSDDGSGNPITPVGRLNNNNFLRFADGSFAPTVGITEAQRAECDVELYLDNAQQQKYCDAGQFNAESFYNEHGMAKLYNSSGEEVRVLRPWETTETKYTIGKAFDGEVVVVDGAEDPNNSETIYRGISSTRHISDGDLNLDLSDKTKFFTLPMTAFSPGPVCTINNKARAFFFDYEGEANCKSGAGAVGDCTMFLNGKTYPRNSVNQLTLMDYCRANNYNPQSSYPFSEGGWVAFNAYLLYLEVKYGTRDMHSDSLFGSGVSSNATPNADTIENIGGVKYKFHDESEWNYGRFITSTETMGVYNSTLTYMTAILNNYYPKEQCMESQMAYSFAMETNVDPNVWFDFYGGQYKYYYVGGENTDMAAVVVKKMTDTFTVPVSEDGTTREMDVEVYLRMSLYDGFTLSGDVWQYNGGGCEMVATINKLQEESRFGNDIDIYVCPNQKEWVYNKVVYNDNGDSFDFESNPSFLKIGHILTLRDGYMKGRVDNAPIGEDLTAGLHTCECGYNYLQNYWRNVIGAKCRAGLRSRAYSSHVNCSPRLVNSTYLVSASGQYSCGSAQCLITRV